MLTVVLYALAAIAIAAVIVVVLVVVLPDDQISQPVADRVPTGLPHDRPIDADDLVRVRLPVGLRGYRMVDTDAVLDRLVAEIEDRDRTIAGLRAGDHAAGTPEPQPGPVVAEPDPPEPAEPEPAVIHPSEPEPADGSPTGTPS